MYVRKPTLKIDLFLVDQSILLAYINVGSQYQHIDPYIKTNCRPNCRNMSRPVIGDLCLDAWLTILEFLWYPDFLSCAQVCRWMNNLLQNSKNEIQKKYLLKLLSKLRSPFERLSLTATLDVEAVHSNMMHFSYRLREWPSRMLENKSAKVYEVSMEGQRGKCFSYRGTKLGGNCAIVANCAFPAIPYCLQDDVSSVLPFSKVVNSDETGSRLQLVPSRVAYYEVKIHNVIPPPSLSASDNAGAEGPPCIVVGLGCALFPLRHRMPGWDHFSFGYHSDDGLFFHNETDQVCAPFEYENALYLISRICSIL